MAIMDFNENHYSVRQKIGDPGSKSMRNVFPLHPVTSKRPESPYGANYFLLAENPVFQFFGLETPYRTRVGPHGAAFGPHGAQKVRIIIAFIVKAWGPTKGRKKGRYTRVL